MSWFRRGAPRPTTNRTSQRPRDQSSGPVVELDGRSRFSFVESLEFWPELDDRMDSFAVRSDYPGDELGVVRGEGGEYVTGLGVTKLFHTNRSVGTTCWASGPRYEGREVHDLGWAGVDGSGGLRMSGGPLSVDLSPDGGTVAHLSWVEGQARLEVIDVRSGVASELATFARDQAGGSEIVRWSPDSRYLLMSGNPARSPLLIEASTRRMAFLPWPGQAAWWSGSPSATLVLLESLGESTVLSRVDLATATRDPIGAIEAPADMPRQGGRVNVFSLDISPDGSGFVGQAYFGAVSELGADSAGGRTKWVQGALPRHREDGPPRILRWSPEWCWRQTPSLELVHQDVRYTDGLPVGHVEIHPSISP